MASLCLNLSEALILVEWFRFQESNNIEDGEVTSLSESDTRLLKLLLGLIYKIKTEPQRFTSVKLSVLHAKTAFNWYVNLTENLIDEKDGDLHASLGDFLMKYEGDYEDE